MNTRCLISRNQLPQLLATLTATLSTICDGMQYGWPSPAIPKLQAPDTPVEITKNDILWIEILYMIGGVVGLPITMFCVDRIGRKKSIMLASLNSLVAWTLIATANSTQTLFLGRLLSGISGDVGFVTIPMYVGEIADKEIRGFLGSVPYFMSYSGILIIYCVVPFVPIYAAPIVPGCILILQLCTFPLMPESPYFYILKGQIDDAKKSLEKLRSGVNVEKELEDMQLGFKEQTENKGKLSDLFTIKSNLKALLIMTVLNGGQHLSSITVLLMNLHTILGHSNSFLHENSASIIIVSIMLISLTLSSMFIDKHGRKPALLTSCILSAIVLSVLASFYYVKSIGVDVHQYDWVPTVSVISYAIAFKFGLGLIPIVLTAELFPTNIKAFGMTLADAMFVGFASLSICIYNVLFDHIGLYAPFYFFSACTFLTALFVLLVVPETAGKSFEEIQNILKGKTNASDNLEAASEKSKENYRKTNSTE